MVSADNDESLILGEKMIGWIGQIADMRNRVPNDGRWSIWKLTRRYFEQMNLQLLTGPMYKVGDEAHGSEVWSHRRKKSTKTTPSK
jgi:hypothetical protein